MFGRLSTSKRNDLQRRLMCDDKGINLTIKRGVVGIAGAGNVALPQYTVIYLKPGLTFQSHRKS